MFVIILEGCDILKRKIRIKLKNVFLALFILILITTLIISSINIIKWLIDSKNTKEEIEIINDEVNVIEVEDSAETEIINTETEKIEKENPYWDYIKMNLIDVNFNELKKINSDTKGWIQVNGTNINYPFVQAKDNDYYLNHTLNKTKNQAGWVFLDYRNDINNLSKNTILYAHGRLDKTMFGSLKNIFKNDWLNNQNNYVVKLSTEKENSLWQVFSVYIIPTTNDYIKINFNSNYEFNEWVNVLKNRSNFNFNTTVNELDKVLTLSTCYNENEKVVLHAKLIKLEQK